MMKMVIMVIMTIKMIMEIMMIMMMIMIMVITQRRKNFGAFIILEQGRRHTSWKIVHSYTTMSLSTSTCNMH